MSDRPMNVPQRPQTAPTGRVADHHRHSASAITSNPVAGAAVAGASATSGRDGSARPLLYSISPRRQQFFGAWGASRAIREGVYSDGEATSMAPVFLPTPINYKNDNTHHNNGNNNGNNRNNDHHSQQQQQQQQQPQRMLLQVGSFPGGASAADGLPLPSPTERILTSAIKGAATQQQQQPHVAGGASINSESTSEGVNFNDSLGMSFRGDRWPSRSVVEPLGPAPGYFDISTPLCEFSFPNLESNAFDAFEWAQKLGSTGLLFDAVAMRCAEFLGIFESGSHPTVGREFFRNMVHAVGPLYKTEEQGVPFHDVKQASCRTMALMALLCRTEILSKMSGVERTALLCASLSCDVGHPGRNSAFLNDILDPVSLRYNGIAPLEQFSCSLFFTILQQEEDCDITAHMPDADLRSFRASVCAHILATELSSSAGMVEAFESRLVSGALRPLDDPLHRREVLGVLLHAADVSNVARPPLIAAKWSRQIHREFSLQHEDEMRRGLHSTPFAADRTKATVLFIDGHVLPLYEAISRLVSPKKDATSGEGMATMLQQLRQNRTVLAARAGVDAVAKSRWPQNSIVADLAVTQPYVRPTNTNLVTAAELRDWNFDAMALADQLGGPITGGMALFMAVGVRVAEEWGLVKTAGANKGGLFERAKFENFLFALGSRYRPNPYHSIVHAADVMQATFAMMSFVQPPLLPHMDNVERCGLLLSALAHDAAHPGKNNGFMVNTRDPVAVVYNGQSVLENLHCSVLFSLLREPSLDVTSTLSAAELSRLWGFCSKCILGTDMSVHTVHLQEFDTKISSGAINPWQSVQDRAQVLAILMHVSDISNPTRIPAISAKWDAAVSEEFFAQGDAEAQLSLPISPGMNRNAANEVSKAKGTIFFIDVYLAPLIQAVSKIMDSSSPLLSNLHQNRTAAALKAGVSPKQVKARWPSTSVVEPVRVQRYDAEVNNAANFPADLDLASWETFDAFELAAKCGHIGLFEATALRVADAWRLFDDGKIDRGAFSKLVRKIALLYRSPAETPYHNSIQASERAAAFYSLLSACSPPLLPHLTTVDRVAILVALLGADAGHPGLTNETLHKIRDPVSVRFSQKQVLENFASQLILTTMRQDDTCDVTSNLDDAEVACFCDVFWACMMSTSMEKHGVKDFDERLASGTLTPYTRREHLLEVVAVLTHTADIANQARPAVPASRWSRAINDEVDEEAKFLEERKLPITEGSMQRGRDRGKHQLLWCQVYVEPLMQVVGRLMGSKTALETLQMNMQILQAQCGL